MGVTIIKGQSGDRLRSGVYLEGGRDAVPSRPKVEQVMGPWPPEEFCDSCGDPRLSNWYIKLCKQIGCEGNYVVNRKLARAFKRK